MEMSEEHVSNIMLTWFLEIEKAEKLKFRLKQFNFQVIQFYFYLRTPIKHMSCIGFPELL